MVRILAIPFITIGINKSKLIVSVIVVLFLGTALSILFEISQNHTAKS